MSLALDVAQRFNYAVVQRCIGFLGFGGLVGLEERKLLPETQKGF